MIIWIKKDIFIIDVFLTSTFIENVSQPWAKIKLLKLKSSLNVNRNQRYYDKIRYEWYNKFYAFWKIFPNKFILQDLNSTRKLFY